MKYAGFVAIVFSALALHAQVPRDGAAPPAVQAFTVAGRVLNDRGEPIANVRVGLTPQNQGTPVVLSDDRGRFSLNVPSGQFRVVASKTGYSKRDVAAAPGSPLEIRLTRSAAISGRVVDELGEPVLNARMQADVADPAKKGPPLATAVTDERGEYRLSGITPGAVVVSATPLVGVREGVFIDAPPMVQLGSYATPARYTPSRVYYPGVPAQADAEPLHVAAGDDRPAINFTLAGQSLGLQVSEQVNVAVATADRARFEAIAGRLAGALPPLPAPPAAGAAPTGTASIRGRVVTTEGRAVSSAQVIVIPRTVRTMNRVVRTDAEGAFEVTDLPAGTHQVTASKPGFSQIAASAAAGAPAISFSGPLVELGEGEKKERVEVRLAPWRALEGRVVDELGDPVEGASVVVYRLRYQGGQQRLVEAGVSRLTNDLGQYRLMGLAPGRYVIAASVGAVSSADIPGYARTYFPGTPNPSEAQYVTFGTAQDTSGIDIPLTRVRTARIAGRAMTADGEPINGGLTLVPSRAASAIGTSVGAWINPGGVFEFSNVAPGQYVIQAYRGQQRGFEGEFAAIPVAVSGSDVTDLIVQTAAGSSITGRITFQGGSVMSPGRFELRASLVDPDQSPGDVTATVRPDWTFEIQGVHGPRRLLLARTPPGWALDAVRVNGADVTDRTLPFGTSAQSLEDVEVVLTDRVGTLSVAVSDGSRPAATAIVVVFAADHDRWYAGSRLFKTSPTAADGTATIAGLAPGAYNVAAIGQMPADGADALQDPAFLESLVPRATTVFLGEAERRTVALRIR